MYTEMTRRIEIDMGHRVPDHASKCRNIHGHRYVIEATVGGELAAEGEQTGMVLDFGFMKEIMMRRIHDPYDHALCLWDKDPLVPHFQFGVTNDCLGTLNDVLGFDHKTVLVPVVPTAENLANIWLTAMKADVDKATDGRAWLAQVKVRETPNGTATAFGFPPVEF